MRVSINKIHWNKLETIELYLRLYVHGWSTSDNWQDAIDSNKDDVYSCPREHGHIMTIDKSFAWTLADRLSNAIKHKSEIEMEYLLEDTLMLYATFKRHRDEYPELCDLIKGIYRACKQKEDKSGETTTL